MDKLRILAAFWVILLSACAAIGAEPAIGSVGSSGLDITPTPTSAGPIPEPASEIETDSLEPDSTGPLTLRVWVPPEFAPSADSPEGTLLLNQLDSFSNLYPGVRVTLRIKAESGPGGMTDSLVSTSGAAPEALPDLVLMPQSELELAAQLGLLQPIDALPDQDWFAYAESLATHNGRVYGYPFAADALVMMYRPEIVGSPPTDWTTTLRLADPFLFPAGSAKAIFPIDMYQAAGGTLEDESGRDSIQPATMAAVLRFFQQGQEKGILPGWLGELQTFEDVELAFQAGEGNAAVTWLSSYLQRPEDDVSATLPPSIGGIPFTSVTGWLWVLSNPESDHVNTSRELAMHLTETSFNTAWTYTAGYLPMRSNILADWPETPERALASQIVLSAHPLPMVSFIQKYGLLIRQATLSVLIDQADPNIAVEIFNPP